MEDVIIYLLMEYISLLSFVSPMALKKRSDVGQYIRHNIHSAHHCLINILFHFSTFVCNLSVFPWHGLFTNSHKNEGESVSIYAVLRACRYTLDKLRNTVQLQPAATSSHTECLEGKGAIIPSWSWKRKIPSPQSRQTKHTQIKSSSVLQAGVSVKLSWWIWEQIIMWN